jgi:hypothetical protein
MPEIQGYTGSAKLSDLFEVTITNSGTKTFLDTGAVTRVTDNQGEFEFVRSHNRGDAATFERETYNIHTDILRELKKINLQLANLTDTFIEDLDVETN